MAPGLATGDTCIHLPRGSKYVQIPALDAQNLNYETLQELLYIAGRGPETKKAAGLAAVLKGLMIAGPKPTQWKLCYAPLQPYL